LAFGVPIEIKGRAGGRLRRGRRLSRAVNQARNQEQAKQASDRDRWIASFDFFHH